MRVAPAASSAVPSASRWVSPHSKKQNTTQDTGLAQLRDLMTNRSDREQLPPTASHRLSPAALELPSQRYQTISNFYYPFCTPPAAKRKPWPQPLPADPSTTHSVPATWDASQLPVCQEVPTFDIPGLSTCCALPPLYVVQAYHLLDTVDRVFQIPQQPCKVGMQVQKEAQRGEAQRPTASQGAAAGLELKLSGFQIELSLASPHWLCLRSS